MKRSSCNWHLMLVGTFILLAVGMGNAQDVRVLTVKVPFAFNVGKQSFPAGNYSLKPSSITHTMMLRDQSGTVLTYVETSYVETTGTPSFGKLVFNGYSGRYFLAQVWEPDNRLGQQLIKSPVEIEVQRAPPGLTNVRLVTR